MEYNKPHHLIIDNLIQAVSACLDDTSAFASAGSDIHLERYTFTVSETFRYPILVSYTALPKDQVRSATEAFTVLFIKELYYNNEWDEADPVDFTQLKDVWIPNYFMKYRDKRVPDYDLKEMRTDFFLQEITAWMETIHVSGDEIRLFEETYKNAHIVKVRNVYAGHNCFGETDSHYFIAEFGCGYD